MISTVQASCPALQSRPRDGLTGRREYPLPAQRGEGEDTAIQSSKLFASCNEILEVRPFPAAAIEARFDAQDCFHTCSRPTFLRPRTGALRLVAASTRCVETALCILSSVMQTPQRGTAATEAERGLQSAARSEFECSLKRFSALRRPSVAAE